jgi:hypothetical protein
MRLGAASVESAPSVAAMAFGAWLKRFQYSCGKLRVGANYDTLERFKKRFKKAIESPKIGRKK